MSKKEIVGGKPHNIAPSPCDGCQGAKDCRGTCEIWRNWLRDVWPVVTGRGTHHER